MSKITQRIPEVVSSSLNIKNHTTVAWKAFRIGKIRSLCIPMVRSHNQNFNDASLLLPWSLYSSTLLRAGSFSKLVTLSKYKYTIKILFYLQYIHNTNNSKNSNSPFFSPSTSEAHSNFRSGANDSRTN